MKKLWAAALSLMTSLGMLGYWQSPDAPPEPPAPPDGPTTAKTVDVRVVAQGDEDAAVALREAYDTLRRLRAEKLEDRSKELVERATELYKEAVDAFESDQQERLREARGLALAARELARTVERLRDVRIADRPDPDLPAPPRIMDRLVTRGVAPPADIAPLPPIPPVLEGGPPAPPAPPAPPILPREARSFVLRSGPSADGKPEAIVVRPVPGPEGEKGARRFEFRFDGDQIPAEVRRQLPLEFRNRIERGEVPKDVRVQVERLQEQLGRAREQAERSARDAEKSAREGADSARRQAESARKQAERLREQLQGRAFVTGPGAVGGGFTLFGGPAPARQALTRAYERITEARASLEGVEDEEAIKEAKFYLDAARDLYNAARRDAEAGRNERAAELARAAEALTHVPRLMSSIAGDDDAEDEGDAAEAAIEEQAAGAAEAKARVRADRGRVREERRRVFARRGPVAEEAAVAAEEAEIEEEAAAEEAEVESNVEVRVEIPSEEEHDAAEDHEEEAEDDGDEEPENVVGIGAALEFQDGALRVLSIVPGSPAAEDGRLKQGDRIVGLERGEGERMEFEGKDLAEVVGMIRGEEGTQVRLIVAPKDSDEETVIELTRSRIEIPEQASEVRLEVQPLLETVQESLAPLQFLIEGEPLELLIEGESSADELPPELP